MNKLKFIVIIVLVLMFLVGVSGVLGANLGKVSTSSKDVEIEFLDDIILKDKNKNKTLEDFLSKIKLESGKVSIDSDEFPEVNGKKAKLTFKLKDYNNPILCHDEVCSFEYKITKEGKKKYSTIVNKWSSWTINDTTWNGTFWHTVLFGNNLGLDYFSTLSYAPNSSINNGVVAYDWSYRGFNASSGLYHTNLLEPTHNAWINSGLNINRADSNYITTPNTPLTFPTLIAKLNTTDTGASYGGIICTRSNSDRGICLHMEGNKLACGGGNGSTDNYVYPRIVETGAGSASGAMVCGACQYNGTAYNLYKNGTLLGTNVSGDYVSSTTTTNIGNIVISSTPSYSFGGSIYTAGVFNRSLSASETQDFCNGNLIYPSGIFLDMPFETGSNSTWTQNYGLSNNGTVTNAVWNSSGGYNGKGAYSFNGVSSTINTNSIFNINSTSSMVLWAKPNNFTLVSREILSMNINLQLYQYGTSLYFRSNYVTNPIISNVFDNASKWTFIAVTYNTTNLIIYYQNTSNNQLVTVNTVRTVGDTNTSLFIGSYIGTSTFFSGLIDEVKIYNNTALTSAQIASIYANGTNPANSSAEYVFTQSSGNTVSDISGNSKTGNLTNYIRPLWINNSLIFDGIDDYITTNKQLQQIYDLDNFTVSVTFTPYTTNKNCETTTDKCGSILQSGAGTFGIVVGNLSGIDQIRYVFYNTSGIRFTDGIAYSANQEYTITLVKNSTSLCMYNGTSLVNICANISSSFQNPTALVQLGRGYLSQSNAFNGSVRKMVVLPTIGDSQLINSLATINSTFKYHLVGNYTSEVYNSSDYDPAIETQKWLAVALYGQNVTGVTEMVVGRAGDCATLDTINWTAGVAINGSYSFPAIQGTCFQYSLAWLGDGFNTPLISNVTVSSFKVKKPNVQNLSIFPSPAYFATNISGNATFILNDTDSGAIWFRLYVDGILNQTAVVNATGNGSILTANFSSGYQHNKVLYFTATPQTQTPYGNSDGDAVQSENLTIGNTNFTVTSISPGTFNITAQKYNTYPFTVEKPNVYPFSITLNDVDNDVNITWSVNGANTSTGNTFGFQSQIYPIGLNTVQAFASDGEYNATVVWTVNVIFAVGLSMIEKTLIGTVLILGMVFAALTGFTDLKFKHIIMFLIGCLIIIAGLVVVNAGLI